MPPSASDIALAAVTGCGVVAAAIDLRTRRIPNLITLSVAGLGFVLAATGASGHTPLAALLGLVFGFLLMLPGHLFGATGAGDVKFFAAMGTLLGPRLVLSAFLYTALAGGVLAIVIAVRRRQLAETMSGAAALVASAGGRAAEIQAPHRKNRFAYAPAIAVGTVLAALGV